MRFLIAAAFAVLLALAIATVVLGVITALNVAKPDEEDP
ncbi:putative outer membrane lipoprotein [Kitasatospora sp. MAA19]|nr:putative outer membrane lipoprotein [Kitasatospora sp. MAA19]